MLWAPQKDKRAVDPSAVEFRRLTVEFYFDVRLLDQIFNFSG